MKRKIGIISNYIPEEIIGFFGTPYRVIGNFNLNLDPCVPTFTCSFVREFITSFNSGGLDFLSGLIIPHTCDSLYAAYDLLDQEKKFVYRFSTPIQYTPESINYYISQTNQLIEFLENFFSKNIEIEWLINIIRIKNNVRKILRGIALLISNENKDIKYSQFLSLIIEAMQTDLNKIEEIVKERFKLLEECKVLKNLKNRVMLIGPIVDNFEILNIIENYKGTKIVHDNITNGMRYINGTISEEIEPIKAISLYYLNKLHSPTFGDNRFLENFRSELKKFKINKVILINQKGCEPHSFYIPVVRNICNYEGIPFLEINIEHMEPSLNRIEMQIQSLMGIK